MNDLLKLDIFFLVTTAAVVLLSAALLVAFFYIIKILRDVKRISGMAREEGERIADDLEELHDEIRRDGATLKRVLMLAYKIIFKKIKKRSKKKIKQ